MLNTPKHGYRRSISEGSDWSNLHTSVTVVMLTHGERVHSGVLMELGERVTGGW